MKLKSTLFLAYLLPLMVSANTPEPTSALEFQQTTNTRIVVEENFLRFYAGGEERMTIDENGNVGIGTTTPGSEFEIKSVAGNDSELHINTTSDGGHSIIRFEDAGVDTWGLLSNYPQLGKFSLYNYNNNSNAIVVDQTGNLGIGTTDPGGYKLNVYGRVKASGLIDVGLDRPADASDEGLFVKGVDGNGHSSINLATRG